jgi:hypothetical protein
MAYGMAWHVPPPSLEKIPPLTLALSSLNLNSKIETRLDVGLKRERVLWLKLNNVGLNHAGFF